MRSESEMRSYQIKATQHIIDNPGSGLFLDMGLGKTVVTLTAINYLLFGSLEVLKVLVVAPKKVAEGTWDEEAREWEHLKHLRFSKVIGPEKRRVEALRRPADIYVISRENIPWLVTKYQSKFPFDMVVLDELTSFKNPNSQRFKALRLVRPLVKRVVGLTGTPAPNGLSDLWAQMYLIDRGERLGKTLGGFRRDYLKEDKRNRNVVFSYTIRDDTAREELLDSISDVCMSMKTEDYLTLPPRVDRVNWVNLSESEYAQYKSFERELVLSIANAEITATNAAALLSKLRQYANGAIYDENKDWHELHSAKLDALEEDIDSLMGENVLIFYQFKHDQARLMDRLKKYKPVLYSDEDDRRRWNNGEIRILITHAASAGYGVNLQKGGHHCFWFGLDYNLELYGQGCKRLDRSGQIRSVINTRILARGTVDERVLASIENKSVTQDAVMDTLKALVEEYRVIS